MLVIHSDQIIVMCGSKFIRPTDIRHNQECQGWILPTLLYVSAEMHRWVHWRLKRNLWQSLRLRLLGKVKANLVHLSCTPHTAHNSVCWATRQQANVFEGLVPFCRWLPTQQSFLQVLEMSLYRRVLCILYSDPAELCVFFEMQQSSVLVPRSPRAFFPSCTSLSYV